MNIPHRKVTHRKAEYWQEQINNWQSSHLTQVQFCQQQGLAMSTFYSWQKKLRTETVSEQQLPPPFIELPLDSLHTPEPENHWDIELSLGNGITLRIRQS
jgi:hypothetical protein